MLRRYNERAILEIIKDTATNSAVGPDEIPLILKIKL